MDFKELNKEFGNADLFLIDQILKGRFHTGSRLLDAGCGEGRNMVYFVRNGYSIYGIDPDPEMVSMARLIARSNNPDYVTENIMVSSIEGNPFPDAFFDIVICINVMHRAGDTDHFFRLLQAQANLLKVGGQFYLSMESDLMGWKEDKSRRIRKEKNTDHVRLRMNSTLLEKILALKLFSKEEPVRTLHIEETVCNSGIWFRKI
jgi:SAM-dependent methyltransferase